MKLKKSYTFIYMPEDDAPSRAFRVSRWAVLGVLGGLSVFFLLVVMTGFGLSSGAYWWPGGGPLARQNLALERTLVTMESRVGDLRGQIDAVRTLQDRMASALDLPPLEDETFAAGVGGRGPQPLLGTMGGNLEELPGGTGGDLDLMLRQVRIQRQGYQAMLDTLAVRQTVRDHIPSIGPTDIGWISSRFGFREDPFTGRQAFHKGLDFVVPVGTPVHVTADGIVTAVQQQRGYGRVVKVDHGNGLMTVYAHLDKAMVRKGDRVQRWEVIAKSGNTGRSSAPHIHYEVRQDSRPLNPAVYVLDRHTPRS
ncbi:hypothetical protein COW53_00285 [bacterium CG17_big_fil_post_rev_8_21_14_2_50_64_8]|nr:MAG: hypothetical protein COW53_00285 [bacterium CG17_big_fil_post_rev_8_21_14_2_50_64_8]PJA74683.1 MAG: hypothetical protein CO151_08815 [bacterium CG_4_9_14_3_um_filter_65_15]